MSSADRDGVDSDITVAHYFAGTIGLAVLRQWYVDGAFNADRLTELRQLVERLDEFPNSLSLNPQERSLLDGYAEWAPIYDGPNPLIVAEEPIVHRLLAQTAGEGVRALDAACGTGRHAEFLARQGCTVSGVDQSPHMLAIAQAKVPAATFACAHLTDLPYGDESFDVGVCSLALCHLPDPSAAIAEIARVLRVGGTLVISDPHPMMAMTGGQAFYGGITAGQPMTFVRNHGHLASTWIRAFASARLVIDDCIEPVADEAQIAAHGGSSFYPEAVRAVMDGLPTMWVWVLTRTA